MTFVSGRVFATVGAGQAPDFINEGIGFMNDGSIAINTDAPGATVQYDSGIALSPAGAIYGTTAQAATDVWVDGGIRVSAIGQLIYEQAAAVDYNNGNPLTAAGNFAIT
jgi:hypothetical protein